MDFVKLKKRILDGIGKYKYVCIVLIAGIILMMIPETANHNEVKEILKTAENDEECLESKLEDVLGAIYGAGKVKVMLSIGQGERIIYQTDSTYTQGEHNTDSRTQTVLVTDADRNETGLVHQTYPPDYRGAIVIAQGADDPNIKLMIVDAVSNVTGLGADKISVLKMQ